MSYIGICKKLGFLLRHELLKVINGGFLRTEKNVIQDKLLSLLSKILVLMANKPEVYESFNKQAELLSVSMEAVQKAWGFYSYFFGLKYPQED